MPSLNIRIHSESEALEVLRTFVQNPKTIAWHPLYRYLTYSYDGESEQFTFRKTIAKHEYAHNINEIILQVQEMIYPERRL
jgi:hypothetical protein